MKNIVNTSKKHRQSTETMWSTLEPWRGSKLIDLRPNLMTHVRQTNHAYSDNHCSALQGLHKERTGIGTCHNAPGSMAECFQNASIVLVGMHPSCRMSSGATSLCIQDLCCNAVEAMADCTQSPCHGALRGCVRKHTKLMSECTQNPCHTMHSCQIASEWHQPHIRKHQEPSQRTYPQNSCFNSFRLHAERIQNPWHQLLRIHNVLLRMKVHIQISPQCIWECDQSSLANKPDARRL